VCNDTKGKNRNKLTLLSAYHLLGTWLEVSDALSDKNDGDTCIKAILQMRKQCLILNEKLDRGHRAI
jgi:hypothetical protein